MLGEDVTEAVKTIVTLSTKSVDTMIPFFVLPQENVIFDHDVFLVHLSVVFLDGLGHTSSSIDSPHV